DPDKAVAPNIMTAMPARPRPYAKCRCTIVILHHVGLKVHSRRHTSSLYFIKSIALPTKQFSLRTKLEIQKSSIIDLCRTASAQNDEVYMTCYATHKSTE